MAPYKLSYYYYYYLLLDHPVCSVLLHTICDLCIRYASSEMDCTEAVSRDPAYVKAFCRRASARVALRNYDGACSDYRRVLELEPYNRLALTELKAVQQA